MNTFNNDGYESALVGNRRFAHAASDIDTLLRYDRGGLYARAVDLPADKAVSRGVEIDGDTDNAIKSELDRLAVLPKLADMLRKAKLTGASAMVLVADDDTIDMPLNANKLTRIEELRVFSLREITAGDARYTDPTKTNYGMPTHYRVKVGNGTFNVHESRLIEMQGARRLVPDTSIPWAGRPDVDRTYDAIDRYTDALVMSGKILRRKQQPTYKMKGLASLIQAKMEPVVQARIALVDAVRGVLNTVAVDSEDDFTVLDLNLSGIKDVVGELQIGVSAECGIPATLLFGRSPGGLNATGEADFDGYHEMVEGLQRDKLSPVMERLVSLLWAQTSLPVSAPETWHVVWPSLESPSDKEAADVSKTQADALAKEMEALGAAMDRSGVSEDEARAWLATKGYFGLEPVGNTGGAGDYGNQT